LLCHRGSLRRARTIVQFNVSQIGKTSGVALAESWLESGTLELGADP
jgi:hypothetical protein